MENVPLGNKSARQKLLGTAARILKEKAKVEHRMTPIAAPKAQKDGAWANSGDRAVRLGRPLGSSAAWKGDQAVAGAQTSVLAVVGDSICAGLAFIHLGPIRIGWCLQSSLLG